MTQRHLNLANATATGGRSDTAGLPVFSEPTSGPDRRGRYLTGSLARPLAAMLLLGMVACTALIVLDAAAGRSPLVPHSPHIAGYLSSLGQRLDYQTFLIAVLAMSGCYAGVLALGQRIPVRWAIGAIVLLHAIVLAGPVLLSQDVFSYIAYGRLGVLHNLGPYAHGPSAAAQDAIFRYVGPHWRNVPSAYGPLFTLLTYPLVALGVQGSLWGMKVLAVAASLGTVWIVWRCAERRGWNPVAPALVLGLNPLLIIYDVGGAHNDLLMGFFMMVGVWLTLRERDALGAGAVIAGAAVKATSVALLPFMLLSRRRVGLVTGSVIALALTGLVAFVAFGPHALDFVAVLRRQQSFVSTDSFPNEVAHLFGLPGVFPFDRLLLRAGLALVVLYLVVCVWRGYDWVAGAGWTLLVVAVTTTWLLAWYVVWALPLAAISRDRRLLWATLGVEALFFAHQLSPLFSPA